jgi:flagellin
MLINADLSSENAILARSQNRTDPGATASTAPNGAGAGSLDSSIQGLTSTPVDVQDADWAIQDEAGADQATSLASLNILHQSGLALNAQANQLPQNVLNLLQLAD